MHELNDKSKFPSGSIVYFVNTRNRWQSTKGLYYIEFGTVIDNYPGTIAIQLYELMDTRRVNGVLVKEFETPTKWQKLPKNWTYDTKLFDLSFDPLPELANNLRLDKPEDIRKAIDDGILIKVQDIDHAKFNTEIDKTKGWRIIREYPMYEYKSSYTSIDFRKVYGTYKEALDVLNSIEAEWKRQSELSDYDWSVEQIDHELDRWASIYHIPDDEKQKYRNWILERDNVEDIEVRICEGGIQWKYWKNKRWLNIVL